MYTVYISGKVQYLLVYIIYTVCSLVMTLARSADLLYSILTLISTVHPNTVILYTI